MPWLYEPQVFHLPGISYLPDFYLPDANAWVEIKGEVDNEALVKLYRLFERLQDQGSHAQVWLGTETPFLVDSWDLRQVLYLEESSIEFSEPKDTTVTHCFYCGMWYLRTRVWWHHPIRCGYCRELFFGIRHYLWDNRIEHWYGGIPE